MKSSDTYHLPLENLTPNEIMKLSLNIEGVKKADEGNFDEAIEYFSKAIELPPKDSISYFNRASLKMYVGDVNGAMKDLKSLETSGLTKILKLIYSIMLCLAITFLFL